MHSTTFFKSRSHATLQSTLVAQPSFGLQPTKLFGNGSHWQPMLLQAFVQPAPAYVNASSAQLSTGAGGGMAGRPAVPPELLLPPCDLDPPEPSLSPPSPPSASAALLPEFEQPTPSSAVAIRRLPNTSRVQADRMRSMSRNIPSCYAARTANAPSQPGQTARSSLRVRGRRSAHLLLLAPDILLVLTPDIQLAGGGCEGG